MKTLNDAQKWLKRLEKKYPLSKKDKELLEKERKRIKKAGRISWVKLHQPLDYIKD